jgi:tetratricopeptide (TPR) repeat protein
MLIKNPDDSYYHGGRNMNDYEFWNELGKIFNAVVAYQEKAVEFNKRFINPWIRLGNVFDKQDRYHEAICAYEKALELDPASAPNWYELGNLYFREKNLDKAVEAYNKAIEFGPESGWSYNNLALTLVSQGKYAEALPLYQKGVDLIEDDKERAIVWNRIGNVYRKLNQYDLAVQSFQHADELDSENAGFRDELDDAIEGAVPTQSIAEPDQEQEPAVSPNSIELILSDDQAEPDISEKTNLPVDSTSVSEPTASEPPSALNTEQIDEQVVLEPAIVDDETITNQDEFSSAGQTDQGDADETTHPTEAVDQEVPVNEQTPPAIVQQASETFTEVPETVAVTTTDTATDVIVTTEQLVEGTAVQTEGNQNADVPQASEVEINQAPAPTVVEIDVEISAKESTEAAASQPEIENEAVEPSTEAGNVEVEEFEESGPSNPAKQSAYDEYLKDNDDVVVNTEENQQDPMPESLKEPPSFVDSSGDLQIEMDTKNAHVWNELGNIYFNTGAYDDAVVAYSKAIQLDRWFAWPYSNLALTYVQKGRFTEAILLYQRSIELFVSEKDKAISWNRLGNVYRRLNNYDNAISAYQRADELDPENTTLSLQSRFSLLGNYSTDQTPTQVSQAEEVS